MLFRSGMIFCCCCSVTQLYPTLCNPMDCSMPGFPVLHHLLEFAQTHVHSVHDAIQPSHPLSPLKVKNLPATQETRFDPCVGKIPWRKEWLPTPVFLALRSPWSEEPARLLVHGVTKLVRHSLVTKTTMVHYDDLDFCQPHGLQSTASQRGRHD